MTGLMIRGRTHYGIVLDESGSMGGSKEREAREGFNRLVRDLNVHRIDGTVTLVTFNDRARLVNDKDEIGDVVTLEPNDYNPSGMTALLDAIGFCIEVVKTVDVEENDKFLITIITDGAENNSHEYTGNQIKEMIAMLRLGAWEFTFMGTTEGSIKWARDMGISKNNTMSFADNALGVSEAYASLTQSATMYAKTDDNDEDLLLGPGEGIR